MYGILLKNGEDKVKCQACEGEGVFNDRFGGLKTCKVCGGMGRALVLEEAQRVLRRFQLPSNYTVAHGQSVVLRYRGFMYDEIIQTLQALKVSGIKARVVFPIF